MAVVAARRRRARADAAAACGPCATRPRLRRAPRGLSGSRCRGTGLGRRPSVVAGAAAAVAVAVATLHTTVPGCPLPGTPVPLQPAGFDSPSPVATSRTPVRPSHGAAPSRGASDRYKRTVAFFFFVVVFCSALAHPTCPGFCVSVAWWCGALLPWWCRFLCDWVHRWWGALVACVSCQPPR